MKNMRGLTYKVRYEVPSGKQSQPLATRQTCSAPTLSYTMIVTTIATDATSFHRGRKYITLIEVVGQLGRIL